MSVVPKTDIVSVRFKARNPQLAAAVVNAVINSYTERKIRSSYDSAMQVSNWLSGQMDDLKTKASESQERLAELQRTTGLIGVDETSNIVTDKLKQLDEQLTTAQSDRVVKEARYRIAASGNPELLATAAPDPTLQLLRAQEAELRLQYTQLNTKYGSGYPKLAEVSAQVTKVDQAIDVESDQAERALQERVRGRGQRREDAAGGVRGAKAESLRPESWRGAVRDLET